MTLPVKLILAIPYLLDKMVAPFYRRVMKQCGKRVYLRPLSSDFDGLENLSVGGVPARLIKMRFTPEEIMEHERLLAANS